MFQTRIVNMLGIRYPIVQAPMNWATNAELAAAVSNAGGLGTLGPNAGVDTPTDDPKETAERMRRQIRRVRELTDRPFAVNFPIGRGEGRKFSDRCIETAIEERIPIAITATGSPEVYTRKLKDAGITVIHAVASVYHAQKAEACGVDIVVAEGYDGGGHSGFDQTPTMTLIPSVARAVKIPVIGAGGIADARGFLAALCLGAEAVYMGTRFLATTECPIHDNVKQMIVRSGDNATVSWGRTLEVARSLKNRFTERYLELELSGASREELAAFIRSYDKFGPGVSRRMGGLKFGDIEEGELYCGAGAALVDSILPAGEVVKKIVSEAEQLMRRLQA